MIEDAVKYPLRGENGLKRVAIGSVLMFFFWLLIPVIILFGYQIRVGAATSEGRDEPVEFDDWGGLFVDGLVGMLIGLVYAIVPLILFSVLSSAIIGVGLLSGSEGGAGIGLVGALLSFLLFIPFMFLISATVPAALISYRRAGSIGAAFDPDMFTDIVLTGDYLIAIFLALLLSFGYAIVINIAAITLVGWAVVLFLQNVTLFRLYGTAYKKAIGN